MSRYIELMQNKNRTEKENIEYVFLDKQYRLQSLVDLARSMGNKKPYDNWMVQDAFREYEKAKAEYEKARKEA